MQPFGPIDFHTHRDAEGRLREAGAEITRIVSTPPDQFDLPVPEHTFKTLELHPWAGAEIPENFAALAQRGDCLGLGEAGLDRRRGALPWTRQLEIFSGVVRIADRLARPLTVHCVGGFAELLGLYKQHPWGVPTLLHYFCGKPELAEQLWRQKNWFVSLPPLSLQSHALIEWLRTHPARRNQVVLETDDPAGDIVGHYRVMAEALGVPEPELRGLMRENFQRIYGGGR